MKPPLNREQLGRFSERRTEDEDAALAQETPERRLAIALALIQMSRKLAKAAAADWIVSPSYDLDEKARMYVSPLRKAKTA